MGQHDLYLIGDVEGFTRHIGRLVSMLNYVRHTTLEAVAGLEPGQLDYTPDAQSNSIGALLSHIAAAEVGYQAATFHGRELSADEKDEWGAAFALGDRSRLEIRGHDLTYYLTRLGQVRAVTLRELGALDDSWLDTETTFGNGLRINNYFKWFHVLGHEINHRGQIRWLRARVGGTRGLHERAPA